MWLLLWWEIFQSAYISCYLPFVLFWKPAIFLIYFKLGTDYLKSDWLKLSLGLLADGLEMMGRGWFLWVAIQNEDSWVCCGKTASVARATGETNQGKLLHGEVWCIRSSVFGNKQGISGRTVCIISHSGWLFTHLMSKIEVGLPLPTAESQAISFAVYDSATDWREVTRSGLTHISRWRSG